MGRGDSQRMNRLPATVLDGGGRLGWHEATVVQRIIEAVAGRQQIMNVGAASPKLALAIIAVQLPLMNGAGQGGGT